MTKLEKITDAQKDGEEIIVAVCQATVWIVRNAWWDDGEMWQHTGHESQDEARGWWSPTSSCGQEKLEGVFEPTHWMPFEPPNE